MAIKRMAQPRPATRWLGAALAALVIVALAVGSAFAFPTPATSRCNIDLHRPARTNDRYINIVDIPERHLYMGPYEIASSAIDTLSRIYDVFQRRGRGREWACVGDEHCRSIGVFRVQPIHSRQYRRKISMIAWLASQWQSPIMIRALRRNADINKAMWEIMADYNGDSIAWIRA